MKFEQIKDESSEGFRRLTGIKYTTFDVMVKILGEAEAVLKAQGGKPNKVSIENRLLMALEYLREYRTYFHISRSYGISESTCYRNIPIINETACFMPSLRLRAQRGRKQSSVLKSHWIATPLASLGFAKTAGVGTRILNDMGYIMS